MKNRVPPELVASGRSVDSQIRHVYDQDADRYHDRFSTYEPYRERVVAFARRLPKGGSVLDLGCGSGANARLLADAGQRVKGYDFAEAMLERARRECPEGVFELADLRALPETGRFEAVLASFCIVHLPDDEARAFLAGLPRFMRAGSLLYLSFMEGRQAGWSSSSFSDELLFHNYFDRGWVSEILTEAGLEPTSSATHDYPERDGTTTTDVFLEFRRP